jgi:L-alanine-DL-glutamate epimerase-like enolase superfamily enzyme
MATEQGIAAFRFSVIEHELTMPFAIASGGMDTARAVIISVELSDGTIGIGESAPFPAVSGETVESVLGVLRELEQQLGTLAPVERLAFVESDRLAASLGHAPAARCGLEQAALDATLRAANSSVLDWMSPACASIRTDITLPVCPMEQALVFTADVVDRGFRTLKMKIGGRPVRQDLDLIISIHATFPALELVLDANCAYDYDTALSVLRALETAAIPIPLLEQPLAREAFADLAKLQQSTEVLICLDESIRTLDDIKAMDRFPALKSFNVKTMKLGLRPALAAVEFAKQRGMICMIGGMVESRLSMTVSAAIAMHSPDTLRYVDLDTPLFMRPGPIVGGMAYAGADVSIPAGIRGHGCTLASSHGGLVSSLVST